MTTSGTERTYYLDTSAIAKMVVSEPESAALAQEIAEPGIRLASSALAIAELGRVCRRRDISWAAARKALDTFNLIPISDEILESAAQMQPPQARALDAIHVATALAFRSEIHQAVTYDIRMRQVLQAAGLTVLAPGQD